MSLRVGTRSNGAGSRAHGRQKSRRGGAIFQGALLGVLALAVVGSTLALQDHRSGYRFFDPLIDVERSIERLYVDEADAEALRTGAIRGMIETLDDPYTVYVPAMDRESFDKDLLGEYVGIGAQITLRDGWLTIVTPLAGSPALKSGLRAEDRIVAIDGEAIFEVTTVEAADRLTGEPGTTVTVTVERDGERFDLDIVRAFVKTRAVEGFHRRIGDGAWDHMIDPERRIAYARLTQFTPAADDELRTVLVSLGAGGGDLEEPSPGLGGLVLDLRSNPGGGLREAVGVANLFLEEGLIVSTRGRAFPEERYAADAASTLPDFPIVVLVNGQSASASEIVAGALKDNGRAIILGERTFGKGSVQALASLPKDPGAQLKITTQRYYLPSGRSLQRMPGSAEWGVDPNDGFFVPMTSEEIAEAFEVRLRERVIRAEDQDVDAGSGAATPEDRSSWSDPAWSDPAWIVEELRDPQLAEAVRAVTQRLDSGAWVPVSEVPVPTGGALASEELAEIRARREVLIEELRALTERARELSSIAEEQPAGADERDGAEPDQAGLDESDAEAAE